MQARDVLLAIAMVFLIFFLAVTGGVFMGASFYFPLSLKLQQFFARPDLLIRTGLALGAASCGLLWGFIKLSSSTYLLFESEKKALSIDAKVFEEISLQVLKPFFRDQKIGCRAVIHRKKKVQLFLQLPAISLEERLTQIDALEEPLQQAFYKMAGYHKPFSLSVEWLK